MEAVGSGGQGKAAGSLSHPVLHTAMHMEGFGARSRVPGNTEESWLCTTLQALVVPPTSRCWHWAKAHSWSLWCDSCSRSPECHMTGGGGWFVPGQDVRNVEGAQQCPGVHDHGCGHEYDIHKGHGHGIHHRHECGICHGHKQGISLGLGHGMGMDTNSATGMEVAPLWAQMQPPPPSHTWHCCLVADLPPQTWAPQGHQTLTLTHSSTAAEGESNLLPSRGLGLSRAGGRGALPPPAAAHGRRGRAAVAPPVLPPVRCFRLTPLWRGSDCAGEGDTGGGAGGASPRSSAAV